MSVIVCEICSKYIDTDYHGENVIWGEDCAYCLECAEERGLTCSKCGVEISGDQRLRNGCGKGKCTDCIYNQCG